MTPITSFTDALRVAIENGGYEGADQMIREALLRRVISVDCTHGRVYAHRFANRELGTLNKKGYRVATLHLDGQRRQIKIHRAIWIARHGLIPKGKVIDHINRLKSENRLSNLRLASPALNSRNRRSYKGSRNPAAKLTFRRAQGIRRKHQQGGTYQEIAINLGVSKSLVAQIVRNELWAA
jgi:hypothetical protein